MAKLSDEEEAQLKRQGGETRRDFSVMYSRQSNSNYLFLGPARFVNVGGIHIIPVSPY